VSGSREALLETAALYRRLPDATRRTRIRREAGITRRQMADALGVSPMSLYRWEARGVRPRAHVIRAYIDLLEELERVAA
jgi:transcriptional regulator with XRE-family HTH domain